MSGSRAKANRRMLRSIRLHFKNPDGTPREAPEPVHNLSDLEDTRRQRRQKKFKPDEYAAELRATDPKTLRKRAAGWNHVRIFLTQPGFREALGDPHKGKA